MVNNLWLRVISSALSLLVLLHFITFDDSSVRKVHGLKASVNHADLVRVNLGNNRAFPMKSDFFKGFFECDGYKKNSIINLSIIIGSPIKKGSGYYCVGELFTPGHLYMLGEDSVKKCEEFNCNGNLMILERQFLLLIALYFICRDYEPVLKWFEMNEDCLKNFNESFCKFVKNILNGEKIHELLVQQLPEGFIPESIFLFNGKEKKFGDDIPDFSGEDWELAFFKEMERLGVVFKKFKINPGNTRKSYIATATSLNVDIPYHEYGQMLEDLVELGSTPKQYLCLEGHREAGSEWELWVSPDKVLSVKKALKIAALCNSKKAIYFLSGINIYQYLQGIDIDENGMVHQSTPTDSSLFDSLAVNCLTLRAHGVHVKYQFHGHTMRSAVGLLEGNTLLYQTPDVPFVIGFMPVFDFLSNQYVMANIPYVQNREFSEHRIGDSITRFTQMENISVTLGHATENIESNIDHSEDDTVHQKNSTGNDGSKNNTPTHKVKFNTEMLDEEGSCRTLKSIDHKGNNCDKSGWKYNELYTATFNGICCEEKEDSGFYSLDKISCQSEEKCDDQELISLFCEVYQKCSPAQALDLLDEVQKQRLMNNKHLSSIVSHILWFSAREVPEALNILLKRISYLSDRAYASNMY